MSSLVRELIPQPHIRVYHIQCDRWELFNQRNILTLTMLSLDISGFEKSVDPDQLASKKPTDQDLH